MKRNQPDYFTIENQFKNPSSFFDVHWWKLANTCCHTHGDFYELFFTTTNNFVHIYQGKEVILPAYTLCLLPPKSTHQLKLIGDAKSFSGLAHFNLSISKMFFDNFLFENHLLLGINKLDDIFVFHMNKNEYAYISYLAKLLTYKATPNTNYSKLIKLLLTTVLLSADNNTHISYQQASASENYVAELKNKLDHYELMDCPIQNIYDNSPMSVPTTVSAFKLLTGKTIVEYRTDKRIEYAKMLLLNTDYNILEISNKVGYYSLSHFIKNFKKATGYTPEAYRKKTFSD